MRAGVGADVIYVAVWYSGYGQAGKSTRSPQLQALQAASKPEAVKGKLSRGTIS